MLGELYRPSGLAFETARAVLEVDDSNACNVAVGCSNRCGYCYVPRFLHLSKEKIGMVRHPKRAPVILVKEQSEKLGSIANGVFLSFLTDPFLLENKAHTEDLLEYLLYEAKVYRVATCSKVDVSTFPQVRHGMTIVSLDQRFHVRWEPYTTKPLVRIEKLKGKAFSWGSLEPYPCSAIYKQDIEDLLEPLHFLDLIVFGRWNYDARATTETARLEYTRDIAILRDFCQDHAIRLHIKSDTLKFIGEQPNG